MRARDVVYLIVKPFLGARSGPTKNEVFSRAIEHGALKNAAAELTRVRLGPDRARVADPCPLGGEEEVGSR
jgi:hypothetical protein